MPRAFQNEPFMHTTPSFSSQSLFAKAFSLGVARTGRRMGDEDDGVDVFAPCTLGRGQDGDPNIFFKKMNGAGANDMCMMATLTRDSILENLEDRFRKELVYTWVGDICISVNPFKNVGCVGKTIRGKYKKAGGSALAPPSRSDPGLGPPCPAPETRVRCADQLRRAAGRRSQLAQLVSAALLHARRLHLRPDAHRG